MHEKLDKRDRAAIFRDRLGQAMARQGLSRSALARATDVDRSTMAQLLADRSTRLPNAHLAADAAAALGVSADWLLGLTDRAERPGDLIAAAVSMSEAERSAVGRQILDWHREAAGYKIRHVPATLPEILKTDAMRRWEYGLDPGFSRDATGDVTAGPGLLDDPATEHEILIPEHELRAMADGTGYYRGLDRATRAAEIDHLARLTEARYPQLRVFLFDARRLYSAPLTVFGPLLAVIYVGRFHLAFRERERVLSIAAHVDWLVRGASVEPRDMPGWLRALEAGDGG
ncbi:MAG: helix-turn-helix transcriptional regulator [Pseudomonadota bacterium]